VRAAVTAGIAQCSEVRGSLRPRRCRGDNRAGVATSNDWNHCKRNEPDDQVKLGAISTCVVGETLSLAATSSSGLPVTLASSTPATCSMSGRSLRALADGPCTITAQQAGNGIYAARTLDLPEHDRGGPSFLRPDSRMPAPSEEAACPRPSKLCSWLG
jgi:hypothetical protein